VLGRRYHSLEQRPEASAGFERAPQAVHGARVWRNTAQHTMCAAQVAQERRAQAPDRVRG
jgi:hypothetical protein